MDVLWTRRSPVSAREVLESVERQTGWAYTTVKTMLDRLVDKGILDGTRCGKTTEYTANLTRSRARRGAARSLLQKAFGGAAGELVHHLVQSEELTAADREELRRMLDEQESRATAERTES